MPNVNTIVGNDGSNSLLGTAGADLIYGFDPNGPQSQADSITAHRVATNLPQALFAAAPPGDLSRLFVVEKPARSKSSIFPRTRFRPRRFSTCPTRS